MCVFTNFDNRTNAKSIASWLFMQRASKILNETQIANKKKTTTTATIKSNESNEKTKSIRIWCAVYKVKKKLNKRDKYQQNNLLLLLLLPLLTFGFFSWSFQLIVCTCLSPYKHCKDIYIYINNHHNRILYTNTSYNIHKHRNKLRSNNS